MGSDRSRKRGGVERVREEDAAQLVALLDAREHAANGKNRAEIALATAVQDYNEFNTRMMKKYKLGPRDGVTAEGEILRNIQTPVAGQRPA